MEHHFIYGVARIALLGLTLGAGPCALRAEPFDCGHGPIKLAYFEFGLFYFEKDGQGQGIDKDVVAELGKRTGCRFVTEAMPRARIWNDMQNGDLDMTTSAIANAERARYAWFAPYLAVKNYALVRVGAARRADAFLAQQDLQFGAVRGFKHEPELDGWLEQMRKRERVQESASVGLLFGKLKLGRIDGLFSQPHVYHKLLKELNMERDVVIEDWAPNDRGVTGNLMLSKKRFSADAAVRWQGVMRDMRADGTLARICARYMAPSEAQQMGDF